MNSSELFQPKLPQIVPKPDFPVPTISRLAHNLSYSMFHNVNSIRGTDRVEAIYKTTYWGSVWSMQKKTIAIYLSLIDNGNLRTNCHYLFLIQPEDSKLIPQKSLFDRFNSLLSRGLLPTLHEVVKDYWIFSDGVPWTGRRTLYLREKKSRLSEKEILENILKLRPHESSRY